MIKSSLKDRVKQLFCSHTAWEAEEREFEYDGTQYKTVIKNCNHCKTGYRYTEKKQQ